MTINWWQNAHDLGLNLLAEGVGVAFTVLIIDRLARRREERRVAPLMRVALRDALAIQGHIQNLIGHALACSVRLDDLPILRQPGISLTDERLGLIMDRVQMAEFVDVVNLSTPAIYLKWGLFLVHEGGLIKTKADQFIERYGYLAPPQLTAAVHKAAETSIVAMSTQAPEILMGGRYSVRGIFMQAAADIEPLAAATAELIATLGKPEAGVRSVSELLDGVVEIVTQTPTRTATAPYRPSY